MVKFVYCQGRHQRRGQWCPTPPFEIGAPPFHVRPSGCCIHPILYIKNVPPFWFMAPPSGFYPPLLLNTGDWPVYCTCCSRQNPQSVVPILLKVCQSVVPILLIRNTSIFFSTVYQEYQHFFLILHNEWLH